MNTSTEEVTASCWQDLHGDVLLDMMVLLRKDSSLTAVHSGALDMNNKMPQADKVPGHPSCAAKGGVKSV